MASTVHLTSPMICRLTRRPPARRRPSQVRMSRTNMLSLPDEILKKILEGLTIDGLRRAAQVNLCLYNCAAVLPRLYWTGSYNVTPCFTLIREYAGFTDIDHIAMLPDGSMIVSICANDKGVISLHASVYLKNYKEHTLVPHSLPCVFSATVLTDDFIVAIHSHPEQVLIAPIQDPMKISSIELTHWIHLVCASNKHAYVLIYYPNCNQVLVRIDLITHERHIIYEFAVRSRVRSFSGRPFDGCCKCMTFHNNLIYMLWNVYDTTPGGVMKFITLNAFPDLCETSRLTMLGEARCPLIIFLCSTIGATCFGGRVGERDSYPRWPKFEDINDQFYQKREDEHDDYYYMFPFGDQVGVFSMFPEEQRIRTHLYLYSVEPHASFWSPFVKLHLEDHIEFTSSHYPHFSVHKDRIHILRPEGMTVLDWCALGA